MAGGWGWINYGTEGLQFPVSMLPRAEITPSHKTGKTNSSRGHCCTPQSSSLTFTLVATYLEYQWGAGSMALCYLCMRMAMLGGVRRKWWGEGHLSHDSSSPSFCSGWWMVPTLTVHCCLLHGHLPGAHKRTAVQKWELGTKIENQ